ncbi:SH3 domain-containing protein [Helicobacter pylori]|uniref:SH3 domain-containing protein n=1 Tax=Helicobacter pylori TaxID=210 RepID=UPI001931E475|nr:SH3 domain-containing protein [Helicobacter pylori]MBM0603541.1 SH3 domain-containing protein [Helicobacter pylori]MBM0614169.1 SH3 domain-containing protein [Helicobacter pylori]MBM0615538.1 SH3 domain-containing protein [Helicobacter pylori]MBM0617471.1 SH3 domain-containing protein [Helicobacter pylori]MBM0628815.1 SH3 domain-containing protein [Helicobacter pylori]
MKTEMKSSLKLFMRPSLVVLAFMLLYALAHAALGFYVKKDSTPISQNLEKTETERQNSTLSPKEEANATTTATEQNPTKDTAPPLETAAQEKETKQETKQEQEKENDSKQNSVSPVQNDQKTPTTSTMGKKPLEYKVAVSGVNVRAFPSTKGKILGLLLKDKSVKVLEIQNDWAEIEFSNKTKGYVFLKLLKKAE